MSDIYIVTDTHFNHDMLVARGFRPADFEDRILRGLEELPPDAILVHLGDVAIGGEQEAHERMWEHLDVRTTVLVRGNHDHRTDNWYLNHGWDMVAESFVIARFGQVIAFTHEPLKPRARYGVSRNIHGHTHGNNHRSPDVRRYYDRKFHIEIALENSHYKPVLLTPKLVRIR